LVVGCSGAGAFIDGGTSLAGGADSIFPSPFVSRGDLPYPEAVPGDFNCQLDLLSPLLVGWQDMAKTNMPAAKIVRVVKDTFMNNFKPPE
jgi:hypothetical protein